MCRGQHGRHGGYASTVGKIRERGKGGEDSALYRTTVECLWLRPAKGFSPLLGRAEYRSPSSEGLVMNKKKSKRQKHKERFINSLKVKAMKLEWVNQSSKYSDSELAQILFFQSDSFLFSPEWRALRLEAIARYGTTCAKCGREPSDKYPVNIDHIKPRKFYPQLALDIENLQPLCGPCNKEKANKPPVNYRVS